MHKRIAVGLLLVLLTALTTTLTRAQDGAALIEMQVEAGYDGYFRDDQWFPVQVTVANNGDPVDARVVVRPQTTRGVGGTYSLPIDLPTNSRKTDLLHITARGTVTELRVELIDVVDELVLTSRTVPMTAIQPTEQLYVVVTQSAAGSIDMTAAQAEGMTARQANWEVASIPDHPAALESVNVLTFTDVDTGGLTLEQEAALEEWVIGGGHLIVTGGPGWQQTAAGFANLLPLVPDDSMTIDELSPLAAYIAADDALEGETTIATGTLTEDASVLAATFDDMPLLVRRTVGDGVVDYLAADPNVAPLRGWGSMTDLWYTLAITRDPLPNWSRTFSRWDSASVAAEILPGLDVLPSVLPICGFLALYIALIGPLNYFVLNRMNRREYAWLSIPGLIVVFSGLAWIVGGELRGNDPSIGRMTLVRSWHDTDVAHTTEVIGLLSPQRTQYTLEADEGMFMRAVPNTELTGGNSLLQSSFQASVDIQQLDGFRAFEFPVDASFVADFAAYGTVERPDITGSVRMRYPEDDSNTQIILGSVTNNTDQTLTNAVILARGAAYRFPDPIEAGDVQPFPVISANQITLDGFEMAAPAPVGYDFSRANLSFGATGTFAGNFNSTESTLRDILGDNNIIYNPMFPGSSDARTVEDQERRRRQLFLSSLISDPFLSTGRGNDVYLVAWGEGAPSELDLEGRAFRQFDTTLYIVELETEIERPVRTSVRVSPDQFVWAVHQRNGLGATTPVNLRLSEGNSIAFRYTPLASARLDEVQELHVLIQYNSGGANSQPVQMWNWQDATWDEHVINGDRLVMVRSDDIARYVGPQNAVILQVTGGGIYTDIQSLKVEQYGEYAS